MSAGQRDDSGSIVVPSATMDRRTRSAVFRLSLLFAGLFAAFSAALFLVLLLLVDRYVEDDAREAVRDEVAELSRITGLNELRIAIQERIDNLRTAPVGRFVYLLTDADGNCPFTADAGLDPCGNLQAWPAIPADTVGWTRFSLDTGGNTATILARVDRLRQDYRLLVGRNLGAALDLRQRFATLFGVGLAVMILIGLAVGAVVSRRILGRLDRINAMCRVIGVSGFDQRLPLDGRRDEFYELSANINTMLDRIAELIAVLRSVTGQVAHQLRTPLTRLKLRVEEATDQTGDPRLRDQLQRAGEDLDSALKTFSAILDIAKAEAVSDRRPTSLDLAAVVADVLNLYGLLAEDRDIAIEASLSQTPIVGEADLLKQLVANLVDNAIKFSPPGSTITLASPGRGGDILLEIADQGPGISEADRQRVFERFYRAEGAAQVKGHGLGLSLVRAIARRHGMSVELADNRPGLRVTLRGIVVPPTDA